MMQSRTRPNTAASQVCALLIVLAAFPCFVFAQDYPLLEELNRQTQSLYRDVQAGLVRVQLPTPKWVRDAAEKDDPLKKWDAAVDPAVRQRLAEHREQALQGPTTRISVSISPSTQPAGEISSDLDGWKITRTPGSREIVLDSRGQGESIVIHSPETTLPAPNGPVRSRPPVPGTFVSNNVGLLLDDAGHLLVPIYIERETMGNAPVRVMINDTETTAAFVGSDDKTQLTILKLDKPIGRPLKMSDFRPADGSLIMLINPNSSTGRLMVWTGGERDYGVVVGMDGGVAGIVRFGQLLGGSACRPVIDQIIRFGQVRRAALGARLTEIRPDDPVRRRLAELGNRPALLVEDVARGSLAEGAGLKRGDFILEVGNEPVGDLTTWAGMSAQSGEMRLLILRDGMRRDIRLSLQPVVQ